MKVLLISDQHFGINDFCIHQNRSIAKFYNETFFPTLISENIKYVFDLGDTFALKRGVAFATDYSNCDTSVHTFKSTTSITKPSK